MTDYISREAAKMRVVEAVGQCKSPYNAIVMLPAADVREVVLCKDCKYYTTFNNGCNGSCEKRIDSFVTFYPNDFCSYGERKEQT